MVGPFLCQPALHKKIKKILIYSFFSQMFCESCQKLVLYMSITDVLSNLFNNAQHRAYFAGFTGG